MSQNFNGYNGAPQNSHASGQNFEGLSGSLIFPDQSTPVQQNYGQQWPGHQGWQNHSQNNFNYGLTFQPPSLDHGPFYSNRQEDFVPFDKNENFYENDNSVTNISVGSGVLPPTQTVEGEGSSATREQMKLRLQDIMKHPALKKPSSENQGQPPVQHPAASSPAPKQDANALNDRAAELRARLLAKRGSTPVTSSNVTSKAPDPAKPKINDVKASFKPVDGSQAAGSLSRKVIDNVIKASPGPMAGDMPPTDLVTPSLETANASTDIEGLFAEARAAVAAGSNNVQEGTREAEVAGTKVAEKTNKRLTTTAPADKPPEAFIPEGHRQSLNDSNSTSDMSELGEIRSESGKPSRTSNPSETIKLQETEEDREQARESQDKDRRFDETLNRQTHGDNISKQTTKTHDKAIESKDMASPKSSRNASLTKADLSTPQRLVQNPKIDNRQDRNGHPSSNQEPRKDNEQDRRRNSTIQENGNRSRSVSGYQQWSPYDRDRPMHQRDGEGRRPQPTRYDVNESARAAAEYKRTLEARRQQATSHKANLAKEYNRDSANPAKDYYSDKFEPAKDSSRDKAEPAKDYSRDKAEPTKDYNRKEKDIVQQTMPQKLANESQQYAPNSRANDQHVKPIEQIKVTGMENRESGSSKELFGQDTHVTVEDVRDWLDMTGYFDIPYRTKGLERFRKIKALDLQRAKLEREAQLDLERRSHFTRSQSAFPENVEGSVSGSAIDPQVLRSSVFSMPPPPLPAKDAIDDIGIKIKDSANRENFANRRANEEGMHSAPKSYEDVKISTPTLKRHFEPDEDDPDFTQGRPADKLARTNFKGRTDESKFVPSSARGRRENWSQENRNNRNKESRGNEHQDRSRSPESWNRSDSPIRGRTSGYDQYIPSQQSRVAQNRRNPHSPDREGVSRQAVQDEQAKETDRPWCRNCEQTGHSLKNCPEPNVQHDDGAKELRANDPSHGSSYTHKKYDMKKELEQDFQPLEDHHQQSRPSTGYYPYYPQNNFRGRGRGRGGYISANSRGGYRPPRANFEGNQDGQNGNGSASLNLAEGG